MKCVRVLFILLLGLAVGVNGIIDIATYYAEQVQAALDYALLNPIDWSVALTTPTNISDMIHVYCTQASTPGEFYEVTLNDPSVSSKLDFNVSTVVMIHGWISNTSQNWADNFRSNWEESGRIENFCLVDWSSVAYYDYLTVATQTMRWVGHYLADTYFPWLETKGLYIDDLILIGHSMGGQMLGVIGGILPIKFMIGLDPAGPLFQNNLPIYRFSDDDAAHAQAVHTCEGGYGYLGNCGDSDYHINGGLPTNQPGCPFISVNDPVAIHCSHARALNLMIDSLLTPQLCKGFRFNLFGSKIIDIFGLDSNKISGSFYTSTSGTITCSGSTNYY